LHTSIKITITKTIITKPTKIATASIILPKATLPQILSSFHPNSFPELHLRSHPTHQPSNKITKINLQLTLNLPKSHPLKSRNDY